VNFRFCSSPGLVLFAVLMLGGCQRPHGAAVGPRCTELTKSRHPARDAFVPLVDHVYRNDRFDRRRFDALTHGQKTLWATEELDGDVRNGGFNQYFFNTEGRLLDLAIEGFEAFGAKQKQALATRARELWNKDRERLAEAKEKGTIEAFMQSYKDDPYEQLSEAWFKLGGKETDAYIRAHLSEFCMP
jgi:hypothetical protein